MEPARNPDSTTKQRRRGLVPPRRLQQATALALASALAVVTLTESTLPAAAGRFVKRIRDTEIERLVQDYARPLFEAAGIGSASIGIVLVDDRSFNAFVADGRRIFVNTGALMQSKTPNQLVGVLAHETGHMAGGHLFRLRQELARAQIVAAISAIVGAGVIVAGARSGGSLGGDIARSGVGIIAGGSGAAARSFLSYARGEELAADRAALVYLAETGQSARGMVEVFRRFADQAMLSARYTDPYVQSHPMPRQRIAQIEKDARQSPYWDRRDPPALQLRHDLMRAKLSGFTESPATIARRYPRRDTSLPARYARAIAAYRSGNLRRAMQEIDALIKAQPKNPYFWELKGQAYYEKGKPKKALPALRKAVALAPDAGLIRILYGAALLETGKSSNIDKAITQLRRGLRAEKEAPDGYRYLARAYAERGQEALAQLASAQQYFAEGNIEAARQMAKRARAKLKRGSPGWLRAEDIVTYKPPDLSRMRR